MNKKSASIIAGLCAAVLSLYIGLRNMVPAEDRRNPVNAEIMDSIHQAQKQQLQITKQQTKREEPAEEKTELPALLPREHSVEAEKAVLERIASTGGLSLEKFLTDDRVTVEFRDGHVTSLRLQDYKIEDLGDIGYLPYLNELYVVDCSTKKLKGLEYCQNLYSLQVYFNELEEISGLQHLKKLNLLHLNGNLLSELDLTGLENLEELIVVGNPYLRKARGLNTAKKLKTALFRQTEISDFSGLLQVPALESVDVQQTMIDTKQLRNLYEKIDSVKADVGYEELKKERKEDCF
jgi:Leucine-rich repeat (LRR) protein